MSPLAWLIVLFFVLLFVCVLVYLLVVRAYYWGDRGGPPVKRQPKRSDRETREDRR